jgi:hypothetical protein
MGEIRPANGKALQIDALEFLPTSSQILGFVVDSRGLGSEIELLPNRELADGAGFVRCQSDREAAARATAQAPKSRVTTLAAGHSPAASRSSASPPRRRACVRDQSYDDGSVSYREPQSRIASITCSRVQRRPIAPGWQGLQYA